ncbi:hypothetical protein VC83_03771 [Pseudogymnoascus destructans]|uniref:Uncharacterized protein n=2 Tax=Pseudogymnoascus destructans TaxID=655981 RepID=L8FZ13_PSED2|nr:uncharacterized protein VC83_03771 [Pseudogymnoascus destructans]ELR05718.1 hypothetical protein GMDG_07561 [Pseudogymnoascus destructans 20631-21]OAF59460.1 hypothetical protein VC83_03771 [Pseudogymnoascus destructans]
MPKAMPKAIPPPQMSSRTIPTRQKVDTDTVQVFQEKADVPTTGQTRLSQGQLESNTTTIATPETDDEDDTPEKKRSGGVLSSVDLEDSEIDTPRYSDDIPILQRSDEVTPDRHAKVSGFTFDELVDRLLSQPMSKADANFTDIFLCMYRKFASPGMLLSATLSRLEKSTTEKGQHFLTRTTVQLRIIAVLTKWISQYPGDFAAPQTNQKFSAFVEQISTEPAFNYAVQEMRTMLRFHVVEDDDTRWEKSDLEVNSDVEETNELVPVTSSTRSSRSTVPSKNTSNVSLAGEKNAKRDRRHSETVSVSSSDAAPATGGQPSAFHTVRDYEIEAATFVPSRKHLLTKLLYHNCMEISDDDFADEITRMDWIMFSSVRVRDLVRDVSLSAKQKAKCKSLVNVTRAINHFNHVAWWVTNLILLRDKAKHRAQILEKFMRIAWKLRQMNNYNGLAAVMAGIQNTAVGRLAQTQALISDECRKQFMGLEILMGVRRSHFAYRLAWQNSTLPRIPYVPLSRRDLASADEGGKTFVGPKGDRINWSKFEVFGGVILPIMKSHSTPVILEKHDNAREIILDCFISADEDEIHNRSVSLEAATTGTDPGKRNRFLWSRSFNQSVNY